jgi:hypothetical protein
VIEEVHLRPSRRIDSVQEIRRHTRAKFYTGGAVAGKHDRILAVEELWLLPPINSPVSGHAVIPVTLSTFRMRVTSAVPVSTLAALSLRHCRPYGPRSPLKPRGPRGSCSRLKALLQQVVDDLPTPTLFGGSIFVAAACEVPPRVQSKGHVGDDGVRQVLDRPVHENPAP